MAIGEHVLDLNAVAHLFPPALQVSACCFNAHSLSPSLSLSPSQAALQAQTLNLLMSLGHEAWDAVRTQTQKLLSKGSEVEQNVDLRSMYCT